MKSLQNTCHATVLQSHSSKILQEHDSSALVAQKFFLSVYTKGYTTLFVYNTEKGKKKLRMSILEPGCI
jgi:hypothetical protein